MELPEGVVIDLIPSKSGMFCIGPNCTIHGAMQFRDTGDKVTDYWTCLGWDAGDCDRKVLVTTLSEYWDAHPIWQSPFTMPKPIRDAYLRWKAGQPDGGITIGPIRTDYAD